MTVDALSTSRRSLSRARLATITVLALVGAGLATIAVHQATCAEDTCVVWVCDWMGNGECGPGSPFADIRIPPPAWR